eukprot:273051_1
MHSFRLGKALHTKWIRPRCLAFSATPHARLFCDKPKFTEHLYETPATKVTAEDDEEGRVVIPKIKKEDALDRKHVSPGVPTDLDISQSRIEMQRLLRRKLPDDVQPFFMDEPRWDKILLVLLFAGMGTFLVYGKMTTWAKPSQLREALARNNPSTRFAANWVMFPMDMVVATGTLAHIMVKPSNRFIPFAIYVWYMMFRAARINMIQTDIVDRRLKTVYPDANFQMMVMWWRPDFDWYDTFRDLPRWGLIEDWPLEFSYNRLWKYNP